MTEQFTFFWTSADFCSQWYEGAPFRIGDETFNYAETGMMVGKARLFGDERIAQAIFKVDQDLSLKNRAKQVKDLGREVANFDEAIWEEASIPIVLRVTLAKFCQNPGILRPLLATAGTTLVEASPYDTIWGIGLRREDPRAQKRATWLGRNKLGFIVTEARDLLIAARGASLILSSDARRS
jgi:ribA/ribD-fused uncharacterized protein